jgi:hypothetical protein
MVDPKSRTAAPTASRYAIWAIVVMVLGWLIALSTGLCGGAFIIAGLSESGSSGGELGGSDLAILGLMLGGIPCLFGVGLILAARKWGKRRNTPADPNVFT